MRISSFLAGLAAASLAAVPVAAAPQAAAAPAAKSEVAPASEQVEGEQIRGGFLLPLAIIIAIILGVLLLTGEDDPVSP
jgi:type IV secretory pathway VirB2 component (pilin)